MDQAYGKGNWDYSGPIPSGMPGTWSAEETAKKPGWDPDTKQKDISDGLKMLDAAGFPNGKGLEFKLLPYPLEGIALHDDGVRIQSQLQEAYKDLKVNIDTATDGADFAQRLGKGNYDSIIYTSFPAPSAALEAAQHYSTGGTRNYTKFSDSQVDSLIAKAKTQLNADERAQTVGQIEDRLYATIFNLTLGKPRPRLAQDPKMRGFEGFSGPGTQSTYDLAYAAHQMWMTS
jgi:ABC-type transport system substrate-binding protein